MTVKLDFPLKTLFVQRTDNHPNKPFPGGSADYLTVHMTGNRSAGADAAAHAQWMYNSAPYSWGVTVDDREAWQSIPWTMQGWHAGDGFYGLGNQESIGIEICMHQGINQERAYRNAQMLCAHLQSLGHGLKGIKQHFDWSGKNCPELIRAIPGKWTEFMIGVNLFLKGDDMEEATVRKIAREESEKFITTHFRDYLNLAINGGQGQFTDKEGKPLPLIRDTDLLAKFEAHQHQTHQQTITTGKIVY